jgi:hypothetical protein
MATATLAGSTGLVVSFVAAWPQHPLTTTGLQHPHATPGALVLLRRLRLLATRLAQSHCLDQAEPHQLDRHCTMAGPIPARNEAEDILVGPRHYKGCGWKH